MLRAIWLSLDPSPTAIERIAAPHEAGVVSLSSAASLHQMGDLPTYQHHLTFPVRKQTRRDDVVLHQGTLDRDDVVLVGGLPCTTPERTIADLLHAGHELEHVAQSLRDGLMQGKVTLQLLLKTLECTQRRKGQPGTISAYRQLDALMAAAGVDAASVAEQIATTELGRRVADEVLSRSGHLKLFNLPSNLFNLPDLSALNKNALATISPDVLQQIASLKLPHVGSRLNLPDVGRAFTPPRMLNHAAPPRTKGPLRVVDTEDEPNEIPADSHQERTP